SPSSNVVGNLKLSTTLHTTAVSTPRFLDMGKELGVALPCYSTLKSHLAEVVIPAVDTVYERHEKVVEDTVRNVSGLSKKKKCALVKHWWK
ncbi:hypothetical protein PMAYCL1PPCAC_19540, partial [Pristionchus mayeri]